jgi:hypothetical protein
MVCFYICVKFSHIQCIIVENILICLILCLLCLKTAVSPGIHIPNRFELDSPFLTMSHELKVPLDFWYSILLVRMLDPSLAIPQGARSSCLRLLAERISYQSPTVIGQSKAPLRRYYTIPRRFRCPRRLGRPQIESYKAILSFVKPTLQRYTHYTQLYRSQTDSTKSDGSHFLPQPIISDPHAIYLALARIAMSRVERNQHLGHVLAACRLFTTICILVYRNEEKE